MFRAFFGLMENRKTNKFNTLTNSYLKKMAKN